LAFLFFPFFILQPFETPRNHQRKAWKFQGKIWKFQRKTWRFQDNPWQKKEKAWKRRRFRPGAARAGRAS
jgi:hypothetical protein